MMKTKLFLLQLFIQWIAAQAALSQTVNDCFETYNSFAEPLLSGELFQPDSPPDILTYFNREWLEGDIWLTDGAVLRNKRIRYNGLLDELLCLEPVSNRAISLDKEAVNRFHFHNFQGDTTVYFRKLKIGREVYNDTVEIFAEELFDGRLSLLVLHSFYFLRTEAVSVNRRLVLKDIYQEEPVYFLKSPDSGTIEIRRFTRKAVYEIFPDEKEQIRSYLRNVNPGILKADHEITGLIQYLNSIIYQNPVQ